MRSAMNAARSRLGAVVRGGVVQTARSSTAASVPTISVRQDAEHSIRTAKQLTQSNAFISLLEEDALRAADAADERRRRGEALGRLDGKSIAIKDIFATKSGRTTCASKMLHSYTSPFDATVVKKLRDVGCVIVGKTNMDEFGMGSFNTNSSFGSVVNPWSRVVDTPLSSGGSSGGSAAAVASRTCFAALGSDTGGSVRLPASYCGIVGVKPSYGRASRHGLLSYASSLDCPGVLANTVEAAADVLRVICGPDANDSTSIDLPPLTPLDPNKNLKGVRVGIPQEFNVSELSDEIREVWQLGIEYLQKAGAEIVSVSVPRVALALPCYYILAPAEASSNLSRYTGLHFGHSRDPKTTPSIAEWFTSNRSEGFGDEVQRRIVLGTFVLSSSSYHAFYEKAQRVRRLLCEDFEQVFAQEADVLLTPTSTSTAPELSRLTGDGADAAISMYLNDVMTVPASLAGLPAASVPCALSRSSRLPLGLQLIGPAFKDERVLAAAAALQKHANCPSLHDIV